MFNKEAGRTVSLSSMDMNS